MIDRLVVGEGETWLAVIAVEESESVVVNDVAWRSSETELDRVEVLQDFAVCVVDGAMALINDDEVEKVGRREFSSSRMMLSIVGYVAT